MKVSCMRNVLKKLAFPLAACGFLTAGVTGWAQDFGHIARIYKYPEDAAKYTVPITTPGETVAFRVRLNNEPGTGNFTFRYVGGLSTNVAWVLTPFQMRVLTGNGYAYASLTGYSTPNQLTTELEFQYTVRAGDLALPMTLYGDAGSATVGQPYEFMDNGWQIYHTTPGGDSNVVWRFIQFPTSPDPTFANANVRLQTIDFEFADWEVQQTATRNNCRVVTTTGQAVSNNVPFFVWSGNTNIARIVETPTGQTSAGLSLLAGESEKAFRIYGVSQGTALIYLSPSPPGTFGVTNFITKRVTVTEPPPPTVRAELVGAPAPDPVGYVTLTESDERLNALKVTLTHATNVPVAVRLDVAPAGAAAFDLSPKYVTIPAGSLESAPVDFAVVDGNTQTATTPGVQITPVITNAAIAAAYPGTLDKTARIKVINKKPEYMSPTPSQGAVLPVTTMTPVSFSWGVNDVAADLPTMTNVWNFGDASALVTTVGGAGSVQHTYLSAGTYTVTVYAQDKDGMQSDVRSFTVNAAPAQPQPFIRPVLSLPSYHETNGTGQVSFQIDRVYPQGPVWVRLEVEYPDPAVSNLVFGTFGPVQIPVGETNSPALTFQIKDGTDPSYFTGLTFRPVITNANADSVFVDKRSAVVPVLNVSPRVTRILNQNVGAVTNNTTVPANVAKVFTFEVADVDADLSPVTTYWNFGDGTPEVSVPAVLSGSGRAVGSISHTFALSGIYTVRVRAMDKDGGVSPEAEVLITVGGPPTVSVLPPSGPISEDGDGSDYIVVQLSSAFTNAVTVRLDITPPNSATAGTLSLYQTNVVFPAGVIGNLVEQRVYISTVRDGTPVSAGAGFTVTPSVIATPAAQAFFGYGTDQTNLVSAQVRILNVAPVITSPEPTPSTQQTGFREVSQNRAESYEWRVTDVAKDLEGTNMKVTWKFEGSPDIVRYGAQGSITHTFVSTGTKTVTVLAEDKDGGQHSISFKITVKPAKKLLVSPYLPVTGGPYSTAQGRGYGMLRALNAVYESIDGNVYALEYNPAVKSADLLAVPYKTWKEAGAIKPYTVTNFNSVLTVTPGQLPPLGAGVPGVVSDKDSFIYVWTGSAEVFGESTDLTPIAEARVVVTLPDQQETGDTGTGGSSSSEPETIKVGVVFSKEYLATDNIGDINSDGIPDEIAWDKKYGELAVVLGSDLADASTYNGDNDFLPGAASANNPLIPGLYDTWAEVGQKFDAKLEIRGYGEGLNLNGRYGVVSEDDFADGEEEVFNDFTGELTQNKGAERPTNPTLSDTDDDGFPDGWEYYFWYQALVKKISGRRYNPRDVGGGEELGYKEIFQAIDPLVKATNTARDLDGDGLSDLEELTIGTSPIHWDTDGDGICDGWEVWRGLDPTKSTDGSSNPDGDYMAYATVQRLMVPVILANGNTNLLIQGTDAVTYYTWYNYGPTNGPVALGRPTAIPLGAVPDEDNARVIDVLLLHFQVYQEFGFDPRTAWTGQVQQEEAKNRWDDTGVGGAAPNTKPFTALDEYLLMEFMSENRVNGAGETMGAGLHNKDTGAWGGISAWAAFSTHPRTPDSDVEYNSAGQPTKWDGLPDGWELYVACAPGSRVFGISPWDPYDGEAGSDGDELNNMREFAGTDSCRAYDNDPAGQYAGALNNFVSITRPTEDAAWLNKFWPTDPWNVDTDGDGLTDSMEAAVRVPVTYLEEATWYIEWTTLQYGPGVDTGKPCIRGGGLNPCTMDTDWDGLPDTWEYDFAGRNWVSSDTGVNYIENGMDGTHGPGNDVATSPGDAFSWSDPYVSSNGVRNMDFDRDGLENYQEYWVQAMRHFRYDYVGYTDADNIPVLDYDGPEVFFTPITNPFDYAAFSVWTGMPQEMLLWVGREQWNIGIGIFYVSTDPREPDSDFDGMDDYYELFHGLNPVLGNTADPVSYPGGGDLVARAYVGLTNIDYLNNDFGSNLPMDFVKYPWLAGLSEADPDADGLRNFEEQIRPDTAAPSASNTDPSPLWMTDITYTNSLTARFYGGGSANNYWTPGNASVFSFEMNEGYDTDNDGVSDKAELLLTSTSASDPQDHDDPMRRQALWFSGLNSAAQTVKGYSFNEWALRSFTVELWAYPEDLATDQVLIERPIEYAPSDLSTSGNVVRVNFRIGINAGGRLYGLFQNAGAHDDETGVCIVYADAGRLQANAWSHIALKMDGAAGRLELWLNGMQEDQADTSLIPANGVTSTLADPDYLRDLLLEEGDLGGLGDLVGYPDAWRYVTRPGVLVLGARNSDPFPDLGAQWTDYDQFYKGYLDEVRVWDGAVAGGEIQNAYRQRLRFNRDDLLANRRAVREAIADGGTRMAGAERGLPAELIYHYTFDNLFGADRAETVATAPRGYNASAVAINRPSDWSVGWWTELATRSTVYTDTQIVPWIENGVNHLPLGGFRIENGRLSYKDQLAVRNSKYWTHYLAGELDMPPEAHWLDRYEFPNSNNPYGDWYRVDRVIRGGSGSRQTEGDLVPLGGAFAKQAAVFWDTEEGAPSDVWAETGIDSDSDGLPDWWETLAHVGSDPNSGAGNNGWYGDVDGDGVTNGEQYLRDIANGWRAGDTDAPTGLKQVADIDNDGLPDWWENIYGLKVEPNADPSVYSDSDAFGDPDGDGLSNLDEYELSEVLPAYFPEYTFPKVNPRKFRTSPNQTVSDYFLKVGLVTYGQLATDHDFIEDRWELQYPLSYVSPYVYDAHLDNDEDGWSNWSEARYSSFTREVSPAAVQSLDAGGKLFKEFPLPVVNATFHYQGVYGNSQVSTGNPDSGDTGSGGDQQQASSPVHVVVQAFKDAAMNGAPDATFELEFGSETAVVKDLGRMENRTLTTVLSPGSIVPNSIGLDFIDVVSGIEYGLSVLDFDGVIYSVSVGSTYHPIGTIDYATGEMTFDMQNLYDNYILPSGADPSTFDPFTNPADRLQTVVFRDAYATVTYTYLLPDAWPRKASLSAAAQGWIREGVNHFLAFLDLNNNGAWDTGEPFGVQHPFAADVGWHKNQISIELTDSAPGVVRVPITTTTGGSGSGQTTGDSVPKRVRVVRTFAAGNGPQNITVLDKAVVFRTFLHEGDLLGQGQFALDWGFTNGAPLNLNNLTYAAYQVHVGDTLAATNSVLVGAFTNTFDTTRAKAVTTSPINGGYVYSARPTFKWKLPAGLADDTYPAFALEIKRDSSGGPTVYTSGVFKAPVRDSDGVYSWEAPIYANSRLPDGLSFDSNRVYAWRVIALNAKFSTHASGDSRWSDWKLFRLDVNQERSTSGGYCTLKTRVKYYGPVTDLNSRVRVQAFNNAAFAGLPAAEYTLVGTDLSALTSTAAPVVNGRFSGLLESSVTGPYYVRAFIDSNLNGVRDVWESWGYANYYGISAQAYDPRSVNVVYAAQPETVDIVIEDVDTDQDFFPDAWEYQQAGGVGDFLAGTGPATGSNPDNEYNPGLTGTGREGLSILTILTLSMTDSDGDGLDDMAELLLASNASASSTADDGYRDGDKVALGLLPADRLGLRLTGVSVGTGMLPEIGWSVEVERSGVSVLSAAPVVTYQVLYTPSLTAPQWTVVAEGTVALDGVQTLTSRIRETVQGIDPAQGFFRVRLEK